MTKVDMEAFQADPSRYELRNGNRTDAPLCPYGNRYEWIGYDYEKQEYVRFTKSVFKMLVAEYEE